MFVFLMKFGKMNEKFIGNYEGPKPWRYSWRASRVYGPYQTWRLEKLYWWGQCVLVQGYKHCQMNRTSQLVTITCKKRHLKFYWGDIVDPLRKPRLFSKWNWDNWKKWNWIITSEKIHSRWLSVTNVKSKIIKISEVNMKNIYISSELGRIMPNIFFFTIWN